MDYKNGRIYQILNTVDKDVYVGSTCQPLSKRMAKHRTGMTTKAKQHRPLYTKMAEIGVEHFYIELIEEHPCENKEQLVKREGHYIREIGTLNHRIEGRTKKEYREEHHDKLKQQVKAWLTKHHDIQTEKWKQYREDNKDKMIAYRETHKDIQKEKSKIYRENNKETINEAQRLKIICECGSPHNTVGKARHLRTKKHTDWLNLQNESIEL